MTAIDSKTALFLTYHNWLTKRQGGFHKLAEGLCRHGYDVDFASVDRPLYGIFKPRDERRNATALMRLWRGIKAKCNNQTVFNFGCPSLAVPQKLKKVLPGWLTSRLDLTCIPSLVNRIVRRRKDYQFILIESCQAVRYYQDVAKRFPGVPIYYRPSDPLCHESASGLNQDAERQLLQDADRVFLKDDVSREMYREAYPEVDVDAEQFVLLPNGADLAPYQRPVSSPFEDNDGPIVCYIGAAKICWEAIIASARALPEAKFVIVGPGLFPRDDRAAEIRNLKNVTWIDGVFPDEVPAYVIHCDLFIAPYQSGSHLKSVRLHSKLLSAMAAGKPIVTLHMSKELEQYGIRVAETPMQFVSLVTDALKSGPCQYPLDLSQYSWTTIQDEFCGLVC